MDDVIRAYITAFIAGLLSIAGVVLYRKGQKDADNENQLQDHNEYVETRKRIDGVDNSGSDDEWLRERAKRKRDL